MEDLPSSAAVQPLVIGELSIDPPLLNASGAVDMHAADPEWCFEASQLEPIGAYVTKTVTRHLRHGNPQPWVELAQPDTLFNSVGLANPGIDAALELWGPELELLGLPVIVSIGGTAQELSEMSSRLDDLSWVAGVEVNLSCPNVAHRDGRGGMAAAEPQLARRSIHAVRSSTKLPLLAKLSPAADVAAISAVVAAAGADALVAVNSMPARLLDDEGRPVLGTADCGMSGGALHAIALRCVADAAASGLPVIGLGGIASPAGAMRMLAAGASAVAIGSGAALHPGLLRQVAAALGG